MNEEIKKNNFSDAKKNNTLTEIENENESGIFNSNFLPIITGLTGLALGCGIFYLLSSPNEQVIKKYTKEGIYKGSLSALSAICQFLCLNVFTNYILIDKFDLKGKIASSISNQNYCSMIARSGSFFTSIIIFTLFAYFITNNSAVNSLITNINPFAKNNSKREYK